MLNIAQSTRTRYPNLCNALDPEPKQPETFVQYIARKGLKDPKPRSVKYYNGLQTRRADRPKKFPDRVAMQHRLLIEIQGPLNVFNTDGEFSSRGLTDWYVAEFCRLNHLKG